MNVHTIATSLSQTYFTVKGDDNILKTCIVNMVMLNYIILKFITVKGWLY